MQSSSEHINHQAREWFVSLQSGAVSQAQQEAFERWFSVAEHAKAYSEYEQVWQSLGTLASSTEGALLRESVTSKPWLPAWITAWLAAWLQFNFLARAGFLSAAALVAFVAVIFVLPASVELEIIDYKTATAQQQTVTLADGSEITLSAKTHVKVWQTSRERHVELVQGLAFFSVAKDTERPFFVRANNVDVRVVGTQFDVSKQAGVVKVAVLEGQVSVREIIEATRPASEFHQNTSDQAFALIAGQVVEKVGAQSLQAIAPQGLQAAGAWRQGQLLYRNARLADVVADANRYYDGEIVLGSPVLLTERVTLALRTDQVALFPELLAKTLPVVIHREAGNRVIILATAAEK